MFSLVLSGLLLRLLRWISVHWTRSPGSDLHSYCTISFDGFRVGNSLVLSFFRFPALADEVNTVDSL